MAMDQTRDLSVTSTARAVAAPAVVLVVDAGRAACRVIPMGAKRTAVIGRDVHADIAIASDDRASRRHARISVVDAGFEVEDLASRNGTFVEGHELRSGVQAVATDNAVVSVGSSLIVCVRDASRFAAGPVEVTDIVRDPQTRMALQKIESIAAAGHPLLVMAETGSGKEYAASVYHRAGRPRGPFVTFNCNNVDAALADAKLFGALKGSHSMAARDVLGAFDEASGGTLFLDEVQDLALAVQGKLLRAVEAGEIMPVGATRSKKVDVRLVCATNVAITTAVEEGRFRRDLYHRLAQTEVVLPPLRERPEAIPYLVELELARYGGQLQARTEFIEACMLRPWPGNVRELFGAVKNAIESAKSEHAQKLSARHLSPRAGMLGSGAATATSDRRSVAPVPSVQLEPEASTPEPAQRRNDMKRAEFKRLYTESMATRPDAKVRELMQEIADRLNIGLSTAFEWAKEVRGEKDPPKKKR